MTISLLAVATALCFQPVTYACTGFIIGKELTKDGSTLYGRTEDLEPNHNKTFVVRAAKDNQEEDMWEDLSNGFKYPLPSHSYKYTAVPDVTPKEGVYDEAGINEWGVSMSATVSASANDAIQKIDPYVKDGLAESSMASVILPSVKTARQGIELIAQIVAEKGSAEGNIVTIADKEGIWYMEILSGHQYAAIKFPDDKFAVFPNTFYLGHVNLEDKDSTITSKDLMTVAQKAKSYTEVDGKFHISRSYNPPLDDANRSRSFSGIKALDPDSKVTYKDKSYELFQSTDKTFSLEDAMALQRNRFEGLNLKPLDQMELDSKGKPKSKKATKGYAYPISNPNVMEAHIFQLKDDIPDQVGGGVMWLAMGSPRNAPYLPYLGNISQTYEAYQEKSTSYNGKSWYWTVSHINDLVAANPKKFGHQVIDEIKSLEKTWIAEQNKSTKEISDLVASDPKAAQEKADKVSLDRAEKTFKRLKAIEAKLVKESGEKASSKNTKS
ncbi:C69 family dipeptidase [Streptococcus ictaluri]|uniref:Dipeptidase n=1 Tax=Streptococcus ictaluri 707-05 TaxID=764299 RepID=G5JZD8_9STRE|nr:C69 family dipeptidase [Streptococcus ictaluri]EHI70910.1 peptidase, C69 family [Streptococcus ictaluri 707-05]